jgi:hypothetical protein
MISTIPFLMVIKKICISIHLRAISILRNTKERTEKYFLLPKYWTLKSVRYFLEFSPAKVEFEKVKEKVVVKKKSDILDLKEFTSKEDQYWYRYGYSTGSQTLVDR